jgi:hypothetical protein
MAHRGWRRASLTVATEGEMEFLIAVGFLAAILLVVLWGASFFGPRGN